MLMRSLEKKSASKRQREKQSLSFAKGIMKLPKFSKFCVRWATTSTMNIQHSVVIMIVKMSMMTMERRLSTLRKNLKFWK